MGDAWKPISEAPRDENGCLIWCPTHYQNKGGVHAGVWIEREQKWKIVGGYIRVQPTHWMPFPNPPADTQMGEAKSPSYPPPSYPPEKEPTT